MSLTFQQVLFPTDFSELSNAALAYARLIAGTFNAQLHCLHVVDDAYQYWSAMGPESIPVGPPPEDLLELGRTRMEKFRTEKLGEMKQTASFLEQAWEAAKRLENRSEEARVLVDLGETYSQLGNSKLAHDYLQRAEEMLNRMEESWVVSWKRRLTSLKDALNRD